MKIVLLYLLLMSSAVCAAEQPLMTAVSPSEKASNFTLAAPNGQLISLDDYKGKYVLVNFWAYWCSPCIKEFPDMQKMYEQSDKDNFEIVGIHAGSFNDKAAEFVSHFNIGFPIVSDPETSLTGWDIPALPMTYLINPQGDIIFKAVGPREWNYQDIQILMNSSSSSIALKSSK